MIRYSPHGLCETLSDVTLTNRKRKSKIKSIPHELNNIWIACTVGHHHASTTQRSHGQVAARGLEILSSRRGKEASHHVDKRRIGAQASHWPVSTLVLYWLRAIHKGRHCHPCRRLQFDVVSPSPISISSSIFIFRNMAIPMR